MAKFESQAGDDWVPHRYPRVFVREKTTGPGRLRIAASDDGPRTMLHLASALGEPFALLYVLVVPRGGSEAGRYQSPWLNRAGLSALFDEYAAFWAQDGRHHLWLHSHPERATLVYDRHNVIFAYGLVDAYVTVLEALGFSAAPELRFPAPHTHQYRLEFDDHERRLTSLPDWTRSSLHDEDEW